MQHAIIQPVEMRPPLHAHWWATGATHETGCHGQQHLRSAARMDVLMAADTVIDIRKGELTIGAKNTRAEAPRCHTKILASHTGVGPGNPPMLVTQDFF